jgi:putative transposase
LKDWWPDLNDVYSTVLQKAVERIRDNIQNLGKLTAKGYDVGSLNWKAPRDFRSFTYRQSGFDLDTKSGPDNRAVLTLKKLDGETRDIPVRWHRDLPDHDSIKEVTLKKESTGAWYVSYCIDADTSEKPAPEAIDPADTVGIDLGVLNFIHDTRGCSVDRLDLSDDRERLECEQRSLSRKEYGSNNWGKQRRRVARVHQRMSNKKQDFKHKLARFYAREHDAVFVEDLNVKGMLEGPQRARNKAEVGWRDFITILKHHGDKHGCHVVEVEPDGTTKECAECGVKTAKPLLVREHSCPSCGFELDRDWNAAFNVHRRGLDRLGVVHSAKIRLRRLQPLWTLYRRLQAASSKQEAPASRTRQRRRVGRGSLLPVSLPESRASGVARRRRRSEPNRALSQAPIYVPLSMDLFCRDRINTYG